MSTPMVQASSKGIESAATPPVDGMRRRRQRSWLRQVVANPVTAISLGIVVLAVVVAILAPWLATDDPNFATPAVH